MVNSRYLLVLAGLLAACDAAPEERVLAITATGSLAGVMYFDRDGDGEPGPEDTPFTGAQVKLYIAGTDAVYRVESTFDEGEFFFGNLPVGRYLVRYEHPAIRDSIAVTVSRPIIAEINPGFNGDALAMVSYHTATVRALRDSLDTKKVFVEGVAMNGRDTFGDSTVHLAATTGVVRATRVRPADVSAGDSVRLLGTRRVVNGQPVLDEVFVYRLGTGTVPEPTLVSTGGAATAQGGALDAALVAVGAATVADTVRLGPIMRMTLSDGSGPLEVLVSPPDDEDDPRYAPGAVVDVTGLLVPVADGGPWRLRVRHPSELRLRF